MVKKRDMNNKASFSKRISFLNARMTSTLSVSLVLFILGIMVLMGFLATNLSRHVKENIGFSIVLNEWLASVRCINCKECSNVPNM